MRNRDLTEALEQQTATSEVLRRHRRSPTEIQPVLDAIARKRSEVCGLRQMSLSTSRRRNVCLTSGPHLWHESQQSRCPKHDPHRPIAANCDWSRHHRATDYPYPDVSSRAETSRACPAGLVRESITYVATPCCEKERAIGTIDIRRNEVEPIHASTRSICSKPSPTKL